jgi:hypothetical protein
MEPISVEQRWLASLMSCISNIAALVTYASALYVSGTRPAFRRVLLTVCVVPQQRAGFCIPPKHPAATGLPQLLAVPLTSLIVNFMGHRSEFGFAIAGTSLAGPVMVP